MLASDSLCRNSLSDDADGKLPSDAAVASCSPRHGVIFQFFTPLVKVSFCTSVVVQKAIVLEFLERRKAFLGLGNKTLLN